jgi:hypothetical protein
MRQLPRRVLQLQASIGLPPTELVRFRLFRFRSPLLTESLRFPFLRVLRCFSSPAYLLIAYGFSDGSPGITRAGLPHSEIPGSQPAGGSPRLIAAIHVLHRLLVPRHPPCALASSASRSLDLTKPAGSTFSTKNPCSGRYPCVLSVFVCSTTLRFFRYVNLEARHKKSPTSVEPLRPRGKSQTPIMRLSTPGYGWSVSPRDLRYAMDNVHCAPANIHYSQPAQNCASPLRVLWRWSRGDSNP